MTQWEADCIKWWKAVLTGEKKHYCWDWDGLPIDETCKEFECCTCYKDVEAPHIG